MSSSSAGSATRRPCSASPVSSSEPGPGGTGTQALERQQAGDNGSSVEVQGKSAASPRQLFELLIATGHRVVVRNERTYANFIALTLAGTDVIWPVWIDTGIQLPDGSSLTIPTGHSHHAWRVTGPLVDARVTFYLGVDGVGFFPQTQDRPGWTGMAVEHQASTEEGQHELVLQTLDLAATVQRRLHKERDLYAPKMPADGYGFLGVCNDSTAIIEHGVWQTITTFPLVRSPSLKEKPPLGDGLDATLQALPSDTNTDTPVPRQDALRRILSMSPHHPDSDLVVDDLLRAQLRAVTDEVASEL